MELAADVLSPELVLVSSPETAARARALLQPVRLWEPPADVPAAPPTADRLPFVTFCAVCATTTLAPLALIAALH
jgi:hypothetical protein